MIFDSSESWHTDTTAVPSNKLDAESVANHEFGHATGFFGPYQNGHFDNNAAVCADPEQTMCPYLNYGEQSYRVLESHDQHTFDGAY
jgi:hypothetical protein